MDLSKFDNYQNIYLKGRLIKKGARTNNRNSLIRWKEFPGKTVLDLGCSDGMLSIEAKKHGAKRVVGVERENCIYGAMELAKEEGLDIEFWKLDIESKEFQDFCPRFDIVFFCAMLNHMKDKERMLKFIDLHTRIALYYETNFENKLEPHLEMVKHNTSFLSCFYLGESRTTKNIPGAYKMFRCVQDGLNYDEETENLPVEFLPVSKIKITQKLEDMKDGKRVAETKKVERLMENIKRNGIRHPLLVTAQRDFYRIQEGGHRLLAVEKLGYESLPCRLVKNDFRVAIRAKAKMLKSISSSSSVEMSPRHNFKVD